MEKTVLLHDNQVIEKIRFIRGQRVMLDEDLAQLYGVDTRRLNEQVKRNMERFPSDFMFQLTEIEYQNLMSQIATSSWGGRRKMPYAFSEHGVLMLSSVLKSDTAVQVNIQIMRIYNRMREILMSNKEIFLKLERLEKQMSLQNQKTNKHDDEIQKIFIALRQLLHPVQEPRKKIGYR